MTLYKDIMPKAYFNKANANVLNKPTEYFPKYAFACKIHHIFKMDKSDINQIVR